MTVGGRRIPVTALGLVAALAGAAAGAGCAGDDESTGGATTGAPTTAAVGVAAAPQGPGTSTPTSVATTAPEPARLRDGDITDPVALADVLAADATGDAEWIAVFADLRARSWLAFRYPDDPALEAIYSPARLEAGVAANIAEHAAQGVYLDEALPRLVSVTLDQQGAGQRDLEVVLEVGRAVFRRAADDAEIEVLSEGGLRRGLFQLVPADPSDPDRPWRIDRIFELTPPDGSETATPEP